MTYLRAYAVTVEGASMANLKDISLAFLDGLSPLDALFGPVERPGSRDSLIDNKEYPPLLSFRRKSKIEVRPLVVKDKNPTESHVH